MQERFGGMEIKKKSFDGWIKGEAFKWDVEGGGGSHDLQHVWVVAVFCHQTHTNVTVSSVSWCVSMYRLFRL